MKNQETKVKNEECSQPVSTFVPQPTQPQPTLTEQTQYITPASQHPLLLEEKMENRKENGSRNSEDSNNDNVKKAPLHMDNMQ